MLIIIWLTQDRFHYHKVDLQLHGIPPSSLPYIPSWYPTFCPVHSHRMALRQDPSSPKYANKAKQLDEKAEVTVC